MVAASDGTFYKYYGTTATSLPFLGGQITAEELARGVLVAVFRQEEVEATRGVHLAPLRHQCGAESLAAEGILRAGYG